jgi:predicted ATP-dependent serine protease
LAPDTEMEIINLSHIPETEFQVVSRIQIPDVFFRKFATGIPVIDALVGRDGFLPGSTFTLTAPAGTGKTTLLLQVMESLSKTGKRVGYISGEESIYQLAHNCKRLGVTHLKMANLVDVDKIIAAMPNFDMIVIDSFQMLTTSKVKGPNAIETYCIKELVAAAKKNECVTGIICHLTKGGQIKGSTNITHLVDMNVELWKADSEVFNTHKARVVRTTKNRFGSTGEVVLNMGDSGYDFDNPLMTEDVNVGEAERSVSRKAKASEEAHKKLKNLAITNSEGFKLRDAVEVLELDVTAVKVILRDMEALEMLDSEGRGRDKVWTATPDLLKESLMLKGNVA